MTSTLALLFCVGMVLVLLFIESKQNPTPSHALWIVTLWMLIAGSRSVGRWFTFSSESIEVGSPYDRLVWSILILLALLVIFRRKIYWTGVLKNNFPLVLLCLYAGISILWSDFPYLSMKRWIRFLGTIPIAMVVLSERSPLEALESVIRRCTYVLVPFSIFFIKYYPHFGVSYGRWSGLPSWNGVTVGKNALGQLCAVSVFFFIWSFIGNRRKKRFDKTGFTKVADGLVLAVSIFLLMGTGGTYSATSIAVLIVGAVSLLIFYGMENSAKRLSMLLFGATVLLWLFMTFSEYFVDLVTPVLGRDETFTGRKDMWLMLLEAAARHPIFGTGFGGYFGTPGNEFAAVNDGYVQGHNGLIDVYVELGIIGVLLVLIFHLSFYRAILRKFSSTFDWGIFAIAFLIMELLCNYSESLFLNQSSYIWNITVVLYIIFSEKYLHNNKRGLLSVEAINGIV